MSEWLYCKICGWLSQVSEVDPDASLSEIRDHIVRSHPNVLDDPLLQVGSRVAE